MTALVVGPVLFFALPAEVSRWYEAAAIEKRLDGDLQGAIAGLEPALRWQPKNDAIYLRRAGWRLDAREYAAALEDYDRVLKSNPYDDAARIKRTQALQHLGRHPEAIADWEKLVDRFEGGSADSRASMLNGLAYARAVGNADLDKAVANIGSALELIDGLDAAWKPAKGSQEESYLMDSRSAMLDTRGFIEYLRDDLDPAKRDLDTAVELIEQRLAAQQESTEYIDQREFELGIEQTRQSVAVIRYHRFLVNDKIGQSDQASQDRQRVIELGFEPNKSLF